MLRLSVLALLVLTPQTAPSNILTLEIRVFQASDDVTAQTRVTIHRAGERGQPIAQIGPGESRITARVAAGIYDAQAVREREGRVMNIRWAERLVVMPYPDENGQHLEVINLTTGYGALQIRPPAEALVALFGAGERGQGASAFQGPGYALFVVPAGQYDIQLRDRGRVSWHNGIDVPLDRTRLWIVP
jgi:hypothetical protein